MSRVLLTLVFVVDRSPPPERAARRVLLGLKKRGFGADKWNGFGGKVELSDASIEAAAARELWEEARVKAAAVEARGRIDFEFENEPKILEVHLFEVTALQPGASEPQETEEMRPQWFTPDALPFDHMWTDDHVWLPRFLAGERISDYFLFRGHDVILEHRPLTAAELAIVTKPVAKPSLPPTTGLVPVAAPTAS